MQISIITDSSCHVFSGLSNLIKKILFLKSDGETESEINVNILKWKKKFVAFFHR